MQPKEQVPDCCTKCGSKKLKRVPEAKVLSRSIAGILPTGFEYSSVQWTRKRCECGQMLTVRTYLP